jgi:hypothetical protein
MWTLQGQYQTGMGHHRIEVTIMKRQINAILWVLLGYLTIGILACSSTTDQGKDVFDDTSGATDVKKEDAVPSDLLGKDQRQGEDTSQYKDGQSGEDTSSLVDASTENDTFVATDMGPCGYGKIKGRVCSPDEHLYLSGAAITVKTKNCNGEAVTLETTSEEGGWFLLENVPSGEQHVVIAMGTFTLEFNVNVPAGGTVDLTQVFSKAQCFDANVKIAVITGDYDAIELLLPGAGFSTFDLYYGDSDNLSGNESDPLNAKNLIGDVEKMKTYDIIFINCSDYFYMHIWYSEGNPPTKYVNNFKAYLNNGGSLYISDHSYVVIYDTWPEFIKFDLDSTYNCNSAGGCHLCGYGPDTVEATIVSNAMIQQLAGKTSVEITYNEDSWSIIGGYSPKAFSYMTGDVETAGWPLCPSPAVVIHNSPLLVSYKPAPTSGTIVFTTFHNSAQEAIGEDMELILKYLIFLL